LSVQCLLHIVLFIKGLKHVLNSIQIGYVWNCQNSHYSHVADIGNTDIYHLKDICQNKTY